MCFVYSCSGSSEDLSPPDEIIIVDTPIVAAITEDLFDSVFEGFSIAEIMNSNSSNRTTSNSESKPSFNKSSSEECNSEIYDIFKNTNFSFDITRDYENYPLTADEIQSIINAPVISTTESSTKYFLSDKTPSTYCATEELNEVPVPNYNATDGLPYGRPTFFSYDDDDDDDILNGGVPLHMIGTHRYSNKFYIERKETTTPTGLTSPSSVFNTAGTLEQRVDRTHNATPFFGGTERIDSRIETLNLTGFFKSNQEFGHYTFEFLYGSSNYFKYSYTTDNERDNAPTYSNTEMDIVNRYVVRFDINFIRSPEGTRHRFPFTFDITIDYKEIIKTLKENADNNVDVPYTKTIPFYLHAKNRRQLGTLTYKSGSEDTWTATLTDNPTSFSDAEYEEFKVD